MKLRAPEGIGAITIDGESYAPDDDGMVEVDARHEAALISHGYAKWNYGESNPSIEAMTHSQMVILVLERTKQTLEKMPAEELRARLLATNPATIILPDETAGAGANINPHAVTDADIEGMNRPELFAFLKAKGVAVSPPIKNDDLRQFARMAVADEKAAAEKHAAEEREIEAERAKVADDAKNAADDAEKTAQAEREVAAKAAAGDGA